MAAPLRRALQARARFPVPIAAPARFYRAAPLRRRPGPAPPDPEDQRAAARRFGRLGEASRVAVWRLWPSPERLREAEEEEREWDPPLREVEAALEQREREEERPAARRFGRLGEASGVAVWRLWPSPERLREAEAEEREWDPPLREVEAALEQREREEERRRRE
ncbi:growth arrest and DNA damage-inducible proteins-interacting protein 1, partial [Malurus melanocephalus]|uniref:growth arrest and DNA damage-inducible proteins-interacting protein 1 n=1 Tax=Malurus melanocephalus TaxID=175006 RepID=UPI002546CD66